MIVTERKKNGASVPQIQTATRHHGAGIILAIFSALFLLGTGAAQRASAQATYTILHSFEGSPTDGATPNAGVIVDNTGNLYGTTIGGGYGFGTIFKMDASGKESLLYRFPVSLYFAYGGNNCFQDPVIYAPKGDFPYSPLIMGTDGNLYGTTADGGANGYECTPSGFATDGDGAVFKLNPSNNPATETVFHSFTSQVFPYGSPGLAIDSAGNLYGIGMDGGASNVFKLDNSGNFSVLISSAGGSAEIPGGQMIVDGAGNLYGTGVGGGASVNGAVLELVNSSGTYTEKILYTFTGGSDGGDPTGKLVLDAAGNLYGTAFSGGDTSLNNGYGEGAVFEVDPSGKETVLHAFGTVPNDGVGGEGDGGLAMDAAGNLYGTTPGGGDYGHGIVFKLTTPQLATLAIANQVNALSSQGALKPGQAASLVKELQQAASMANAGKTQGSIGILEGFIAHVNGLLNSGALTSDQASGLTSAANSVIAQLV